MPHSCLQDQYHAPKNAPPTGGHVFQATGTTFELVQNIIGTNLLTKFHDDRTINMASGVLTRFNYSYIMKMPRPLGGNVFQPTRTIFELIQDIIGTDHLTKFHDDRTINVASRVKNAPPPGGHFHEDQKINVASRVLTSHVFQPTSIIFERVQDIIGVNLLTKFHEDRTINVASRVLTRFYYSHIRKNAPPLGSHTNLLTKFHEDWTINVASRVFTGKNAPPLGSHVFQANITIFKLIQDIIETNLPTKFHEDWTINVASRVLTRKTAPPPGGHVFSPIWAIFELFHDDWTKIVTSRVFTRNTARPPGGHLHEDWASNVTSTVFTSFKLSRGINGTNTINVASRVFTRQNVDDG
ncbi:hypothetical protein DPMN_080210 [Dreissena polymorpha]|uniref:Uncharacterized protein n=1 Tax=Dreissena polymorpha TaxID=45954 RepID=A0A9D3YU20_DREPO|nr:hypothetical protein DPMN_080210 [Dreissena polymorpha]